MSTHWQDVVNLEKAIGHMFQRPELLEQALTHSSRAKEAEVLQRIVRQPPRRQRAA